MKRKHHSRLVKDTVEERVDEEEADDSGNSYNPSQKGSNFISVIKFLIIIFLVFLIARMTFLM